MRLAKIVNHKIAGIVEADVADDRKDEEGNLIYRPIHEDQTPVPPDHVKGGDEYIIEQHRVVRKFKFVRLNPQQIRQKKLSQYYGDPELPSADDRLDALEADDKPKIAQHKAKIAALKQKHGIQ